MVRGLVEDDQVRLLQQELTQCNAGFLAAGKGADGLGKLFFGKAKAFQNADDLALTGIPAAHFISVREIGIPLHQSI